MPVVVNDGLAEDLLDIEPGTLSAERSRADRDGGDAVGTGPEGLEREAWGGCALPLERTEAAACERAAEESGAAADQELSPPERMRHGIARA